jgi:hypothetical protein
MIELVEKLIVKYRNKGILIDANLLLMLLVGSVKPDMIPNFKRTRVYAKEDYDTLRKLIDFFNKVVTTPNILTEVSNLSNSLEGKYKSQFYEAFSDKISILEERHIESRKAASFKEFDRFGLTDSIIFHISRGNYLLLTDDFRLSQYIQSLKGDVINFNHIRVLNWSSKSFSK